MSESHKETLSWYEDNCNEIKKNDDGSVTFIFDEPPIAGALTSSTTVSKVDYERAKADPNFRI